MMQTMEEILAILQIAENAYQVATSLLAAAQAKGDPTTAEVQQQIADTKAANDAFHALLP